MLVDALKEVIYPEGMRIVTEGDDGHQFFIIKDVRRCCLHSLG